MSAEPLNLLKFCRQPSENYFCNNNTKRKVNVTRINLTDITNVDKFWRDTNSYLLQYLAFPAPSEWATLSILTRPTPTELWWVLLQNLTVTDLSLCSSPSLKVSTKRKKFLATNSMMKTYARTPHLAHLEAVGNLCWKNGLIWKVNCECEQKLWQLVVA